MPSGKEPQRHQGGPRKGRRYSSPERVNTARPDEEHCNLALQQINAVEEMPASDDGFSFTDSPNLQRLKREAYELSEGQATAQMQIPLFQRPTSSGSLQRAEGFTFPARQHREMNVRREKPPPIRQESLPSRSNQESQITKNVGEQSDMGTYDGTHSMPRMQHPGPASRANGDPPPEVHIDLTCASPSAATQDFQVSPTADPEKPSPNMGPQDRAANADYRSNDGSLTNNELGHASAPRTEAVDTNTEAPVNAEQVLGGQKHTQNVRHPLPNSQETQLQSKIVSETTRSVEQQALQLDTEQARPSGKGTQDCSAPDREPFTTFKATEVPRDQSPDDLETTTVPKMQSIDIPRPQGSSSGQGNNRSGPVAEISRCRSPHTPQVYTPRFAGRVTKMYRSGPNLQPRQMPAASSEQINPNVMEAATAPRDGVSCSRDPLPSEEDLYYLLMHRQRQRKDVETRALARQKQLETANARLHQQNQNFQLQLIAARASREEVATNASCQKTAMAELKTRFQKLKNFVNGLGNDYSALRQEADQMKLSQQSLSTEKEALYKDLESCHTALSASERSTHRIVSTIAEVRQTALPLEQSLLDTKKALENESKLLSKEQRRNKRLETYLFRVATTQNRYSSAIQDEQKRMLHELRSITGKIDAAQLAAEAEQPPLQLPGLDECVRMLTVLHDADRLVPADLTKVTEAVGALTQSLSSHQNRSDERFQTAADAQIDLANQLVAQVTTLLQSFRASSIQEENLYGLREDKIRLEEQLKSSEKVIHEIRESRTSADARESHLRNTTDTLLNNLKTLRSQPLPVDKPPPTLKEQDMLSSWQMKYTSMSQQLISTEERVSIREKEIRQGEEEMKKLKERLEELQTERDNALQSLNQANDKHIAEHGEIGELQEKLTEKETSLEALLLELQSSKARICETAETMQQFASLRKKHETELEEIKSQLKKATQSQEKADEQVQKLSNSLENLADVQEESKKVAQLTEELQKECAIGKKLRQEIAPLEETARQVSELKQELSAKQKTVASLEARLTEVEAVAKQVEIMERDASMAAKETSMLKAELTKAQKNAMWVADQKEELCKATQEVEELRKKVIDIRAFADRVPVLEKTVQDHLDEITHLKQEVANSQRSNERQQDLQEVNIRCGEEIASLKGEVVSAAEKLKDLQNVLDANDQKDREVESLNERLKVAEDSLSHLQDLRETISDRNKHIMTLDQELNVAKEELEHLETVQDANSRKDEEILSLQQRLRAAESILDEVQVVKEESQRKDDELSNLRKELAKLNFAPQFSRTIADQPSQDLGLSQGTLAALQDVITDEGGLSQDELFVAEPLPVGVTIQYKRRAGRTVTWGSPLGLTIRSAESSHAESQGKQVPLSSQIFEQRANRPMPITGMENVQTQETTSVPESQPAANSQYGGPAASESLGCMSSPMTNDQFLNESSFEAPSQSAYFDSHNATDWGNPTSTKVPVDFEASPLTLVKLHADLASSRPPSSSYGEPMLLEEEEELNNIVQPRNSALQERSIPRTGHLSGSSSSEASLGRKIETTSSYGAKKPPTKPLKGRGSGGPSVSSKHPSPRRLRSESQTQPKKYSLFQEHELSAQIIPASPREGSLREKHLPNSAAKRRLDDEEISMPSSSHDSSKRLKRNLSAFEGKTSKGKGTSVQGQVDPAPSTTHLNHPSMPSGGRKGSIIGTNAPAPGAGQRTSKKSGKSSKTDRYTARFGQKST